jgi:hypothetical protein
MPFHVVETQVDEDGKVLGRNVSIVPFPTKKEADQAAARNASWYSEHGFNEEHGLWWAKDPAGRIFYIFTESY